ncbi:MAG: RHS repeat domain-containing protein, partial [Bacteroidales bacterium]
VLKSTITDIEGNTREVISEWKLSKVTEVHGDYMEYFYEQVDETVRGSLNAKALYLKSIKNNTGTEVVFTSNSIKTKKTNNARYGFLSSSNKLLDKVDVKFEGDVLRSYTLEYKDGVFHTKLLDKITHLDNNGDEFASHTFDYYDDVENGGTLTPFKDGENWKLHDDNLKANFINPLANFGVPGFSERASALGGNKTTSTSFSTYAGVGVTNFDPVTKSMTVGANFSHSRNRSKGLSSLIDINGDGLPDKVFVEGGSVYYRPNLSTTSESETKYGDKIRVKNISKISDSKSRTFSVGGTANPGFYQIIAVAGTDFSQTKSETSTYFSDVNGDGLTDLISGGKVHFNHIEKGENGELIPVFTESSANTPSPIIGGGVIDASATEVDPEEQADMIKYSPMQDVVRVWEAPFDGKVNVTGSVKLLQPDDPLNEEGYENADGVRVAIQVKGSEKWNKSIAKDDASSHSATLSDVEVKKGDRIYFRVQSGNQEMSNGVFDRVSWNPTVSYEEENDGTPYGYSSVAYNAAESQITTSETFTFISEAVPFKVNSTFEKPLTSDSVTLQVYLSNNQKTDDGQDDNPNYFRDLVWEKTFAGDEQLKTSLDFDIENDKKGQNIEFKVVSSTNVDWNKVKWSPVVTYQNNNMDMDVVAYVHYDVKANHLLKGKSYSLQSNDTLCRITPDIDVKDGETVSGSLIIAVKKEHELLAKKEIYLLNNAIAVDDYIDTIFTEPGKVWIEYYADAELLDKLDSLNVKIRTIKESSETQADVYTNRADEGFGAMYRAWGQFTYNASDNRYTRAIDENLLKLPESEDAELDPLTTAFIPMVLENDGKAYYKGQNPYTWINNDVMCASRLSEQEVVLTNPLAGMSTDAGNWGSGAFRPGLETKSKSNANMAGVMGVTTSKSKGDSETTLSVADMNGDGYPDILSGNDIQLTNPQGGFDGEIIYGINNHKSESESNSWGYGGNPIHAASTISATASYVNSVNTILSSKTSRQEKMDAAEKMNSSKTALENSKNQVGISGSVSFPRNEDHAVETYLDVNGDGLPDKINSDKTVSLNLGYTFADAVNWDLDRLEGGEAKTVNAGMGFDFGASSISAGFGLTTTTSNSEYSLMDINADGLIDKVWKNGDNISVSLNTGDGFDTPIVWKGISEIGTSASTAESVNAAYTQSFFVWLVKISLNAGNSLGQTMDRSLTAIRDVDGDGYPDFISTDKDEEMTVKRSTIGRTNKLKEVHNPLGGSFAVDYKRSPATYSHPGGKWVMASLEINDGINDDGVNSITEFDYADGVRDRYEREFLGFGKVVTKQIDSENSMALYRSVEQDYDVSSYYTAGNSLGSTLKDADNNIYTQSSQEYYTYRVKSNGDSYTFSNAGDIGILESPAIFTPLQFSQSENKEGGNNSAILQQSHYTYRNGATGELSSYKFSDKGSLSADGDGDFNYQTTIDYTDLADKRILGLPAKVQVKGADGNLYRETTASYDKLAHITQVSQTLESGKATSDFEWDKYGNITKRTMPENSTGQRMWYSYKYESDYNMYVERIEDAWGYRSELEDYDYRFGVAMRTKDINGYYQEQEIDEMGRITQITAPNELAEGVPFTIRFEYHNAKLGSNGIDAPAYALTQHYDPEHPDNFMNTTTFVDGMGRAIQVKKDGVVAEGGSKQELSIVSGRAYFDAFGRAVKAYYPTTVSLSEFAKFSNKFDNVTPTITTFDVMDRALQITMPDGTQTTNAYSVEGNLQVVKTTDAEGGEQASYTNGSGLNVKTEQLSGPSGTITTSFEYDAINQLLKAIDTEGHAIVSTYDMGGRRTSVTHPDAGTSRFTYDNLGNVLTKQTANLADSSAVINYAYDYHRLTAINYPLHPENNVRYHYGDKHSTHNRRGRLALQEDASGAQEFYYGLMGELTKVRRTHIIPNHAVATFEMQWKYDSWNRVQEMIYPDKEKLSYHYDAGGQLQGLTGNKSYGYNYVQDIGYDKFGQRTYI